MEQLHKDLENLLIRVGKGWCAYKPFNVGEERDEITKTGIGGCLLECMVDVVGYFEFGYRRRQSMIKALGFTSESGNPDGEAMYTWNDEQRDVEVVKLRVRNALDKLSS